MKLKTLNVGQKCILRGFDTKISLQEFPFRKTCCSNIIFQVFGFILQKVGPVSSLRTCDHGPTLHWVGQGCRLQGLRASGLSSLQCLLWMERVVLSSDGWTQLTARICKPVFPHGLLQFCHSPVTQLDNTTGERESRGHLKCQSAVVNKVRGGKKGA